ncbi:MAG TPA: hypothetical protein VFG58_03465 [Solirubrobacterales bacterium]|nr:hypothetical protein [Solirubrobacterales bacterium]
MKRLTATLATLAAAAFLLAPAAAQAEFGIKSLAVQVSEADGSPATQAGAHPFAFSEGFEVNAIHEAGGDPPYVPDGRFKDAFIEQMEGIVADTTAYPACSAADFLAQQAEPEGTCPEDTQVGVSASAVSEPEAWNGSRVYNLVPPPGVALRLGFHVTAVSLVVDLGISQAAPYAAFASARSVPETLLVFGNKTQVWGNPSDPRHDELRGDCYAQTNVFDTPVADFRFESESGKSDCAVEPNLRPFLTLPTRCEGANETTFAADSYERPGSYLADAAPDLTDPAWSRGTVLTPSFEGCEKLGLNASIQAKPTTLAAQSASGLDFTLDVTDEGLTSASAEHAGSDIRKTVVRLPEGMTVNPSQAEGLEACSEADLARETLSSGPGAGCPEASKIGTIEVQSPLVDEAIGGALYVAKPYENLAGDSLIAVYAVFKNPQLGIIVKQPIEVEPDPLTGRLVGTAEDIPQLPFSSFRLHFREGGRAPLISPPGCGEFQTEAKLYPWSGGPPTTSTSAFTAISGPGGSACPAGAAPFDPGFEAGTLNNAAARYSPFYMRITRGDGEQDLTKLSQVLPPGVLAKLAGVPYCPEAAIALAASRQGPHGGREELSHPACPAASQIGRTAAGAGVGSELTYVSGSLYLAGPYHGDPLSVVSVTPAVAGPFDAGTVVVRFALTLNPVSGEAELDGAASDPIPHILKGIPLNVRDLRAWVDRPDFTLNATSCERESTRATLWGGGTVIDPRPDSPVARRARYQAAGCRALGFKPHLAIKLRGGTKRGRFPALHAVYAPKAGDANLSRLALAFPKSEFVEQGHFRTICTRVQFAAGAGHGASCPKGATYGHVKVWTPLLDEPLSGPVMLRSSNHNLPDAIFVLHGPPSAAVDLEVAIRIDSVHGRLRVTVGSAPDAPVSRAVVDMQGGQKGLFVNSRNLCFKPARNRANARLRGQNGKISHTRPVVRALRCGHRKRHRVHRRRGGRR